MSIPKKFLHQGLCLEKVFCDNVLAIERCSEKSDFAFLNVLTKHRKKSKSIQPQN